MSHSDVHPALLHRLAQAAPHLPELALLRRGVGEHHLQGAGGLEEFGRTQRVPVHGLGVGTVDLQQDLGFGVDERHRAVQVSLRDLERAPLEDLQHRRRQWRRGHRHDCTSGIGEGREGRE